MFKRALTQWSSELAYAVGLIATDGNLSKNGRTVIFVSKDIEQIKTFKNCLEINSKVCVKNGGYAPDRKYYFLQLTDKKFYNFLISIGLMPAKSKILGALNIPGKYFFDFLRGCLDGDGSFYSYWDKRWASSYLFYLSFMSASLKYMKWMRGRIYDLCGVSGHINYSGKLACTYQLKYAKAEAKILIDRIYYNEDVPRLERKYKKIYSALQVENLHNSGNIG
jgi:hypothetical protein